MVNLGWILGKEERFGGSDALAGEAGFDGTKARPSPAVCWLLVCNRA